MGSETLTVALVLAALLLPACERSALEREVAAAEVAAAEIDIDLAVSVAGAIVVSASAATPDRPARLHVRATTLAPEIILEEQGCGPRFVDVVVDNAPVAADWTWRGYRGALPTAAEAERQCCGTLLGSGSAALHPDWLPVGPEQGLRPGRLPVQPPEAGEALSVPCTGDLSLAGGQAGGASIEQQAAPGDADAPLVQRHCWRLRLRPSTDEAAQVPTADALPVAPAVACGDYGTLEGGPARQAPFLVVQRGLWKPDPVVVDTSAGEVALRFAVFGNSAGETSWRRTLVETVNALAASRGLRFALVTGDMAGSGSTSALDAAVEDLNALRIPWYATVGERDVDGADSLELVRRFGPLTYTFDVFSAASTDTGAARGRRVAFRVVLLDSAEGGLTRRAFERLSTWLEDEAAPGTRLAATHVPPFDLHGLRGKGFKSRFEAARFVAALHRGEVGELFTSHLAVFARQPVAGLDVWHSGGGGAPPEALRDDPRHFLVVTVNNLGALSVERVDLRTPP